MTALSIRRPLSPELLAACVAMVRRSTGIVVPEHRLAALEHALSAVGATSLQGLERTWDRHSQTIIDAVTIGETYFFREPGHYERLALHARQLSAGGRPCHVLCAGSASGEEAWSAAAVIASVYLHHGAGGSVLGWDIDAARLETARRGRYPRWSARRGFGGYQRFFKLGPDEVEVSERLFPFVRFSCVNLADDEPADGAYFDAIFFRNVSIYWDKELTTRVVRHLASRLRPGGLFFPGASDYVPLTGAEWASEIYCGARVVRRVAASAYSRSRDNAATTQAPKKSTPAVKREIPGVVRTPAPAVEPATGIPEEGPELGLAQQYADEGDYEAALKVLSAMPENAAPRVEALRGIVFLNLSRVDDALQSFLTCVYWEPDNADYHAWLALAYEQAGRTDDARREFQNVERLKAMHVHGL